MINITQFRQLIVQPILRSLVLDSAAAEELLVFTCANESLGGTYLKQVEGPALGIYQMEPETHTYIWQNYILNQNHLRLALITNFSCHNIPIPDRLIWDLHYATAMARIFYARIPEALPPASDIDAIWSYYKRHYNTFKGSAQKDSAVENYQRFVSG